VDYGRAWNTSVANFEPQDLASVGAGLIWNIWQGSRFEVYWGKQLSRLKLGEGNLQDHGVHLQLVVQAF
jgi:hemolysin activation/secretion protein